MAKQSGGKRQRQGASGGRGGQGTGGNRERRGRTPDRKGLSSDAGRSKSRSAGSSVRGAAARPGASRRPAGEYIERAAAEALRTGFPVKRALVADAEGRRDAALAQLVDQLRGANIPVEYVAAEQLDALSSHGAHQGIALEVGAFPYADLADIIARADAAGGTGPALVVVLDHVTDAGNFGAIVRSAEVVGAVGVVIANKRAAEVTVATYKTSAGAVMHLPIARVPNIARALEQLKAAGFWTVGASEHAEGSCWDAPLTGRIALVMGSEGDGISRLVLETCDDLTAAPPQRRDREPQRCPGGHGALLRVAAREHRCARRYLGGTCRRRRASCTRRHDLSIGKNVPKTAHSEADFGTFLPEFRRVSATVGAASSAAPATDGVGGARE